MAGGALPRLAGKRMTETKGDEQNMKVALSVSGNDLDASIDPRFGRCARFIVVDPETMQYEVFDNGNVALGGGAGINAAQFVASKGADVVITGNCGPNAMRTLSAAGVRVIIGQGGTVRETLERFRRGELESTTNANVKDHYGLGGSAAYGQGSFAGRQGAGGGRGGGMGCRTGGGGKGWSGDATMEQNQPAGGSSAEDLRELGDSVKALRKQLEALEARMKEMGKS